MKTPRLYLVHGWGFAPCFWETLVRRLPPLPVVRADLGFFGPESWPSPPEGDGPLVAVGHSLGFPSLLEKAPFVPHALASLGGFARFEVPAGPVRAMRRGLSRDAARVLSGFWTSCGLSAQPVQAPRANDPGRQDPDASRPDPGRPAPNASPTTIDRPTPDASQADPARLAEGLDRLLTLDLTAALDAWTGPLLAVAAEDDSVVPPDLSRRSFPRGLTMLPHGGHAFPVTKAWETARLLASFLESL